MKYLAAPTFIRLHQLSRRGLCLLVVFVCLGQLAAQQVQVFADDINPCSTETPASQGSQTGGLSECQKQIYSEGITSFDVANENQDCVVQSGPSFSGSDNKQSFYNYMLGQPVDGATGGQGHLQPLQIAALMGNIEQESHFDPSAKNSIGAFGIVQWLNGRYDNLVKYAQSQSLAKDDFGAQAAFVWVELSGAYKQSTLDPLSQATDIETATEIVFKHYEVAGDSSLPSRIAFAKQALATYGGGAAAVSDATLTQPVISGSSSDSSGSCNNTNPGQDTQFVNGFAVYSQYDPDWKDSRYGTSTIGDSGCGPSAMAMIITALTGKKVTPADTTAYANTQGIYIPGEGSSWEVAPTLAQHWGLKAEAIGADIQKITTTLQTGGLVIGSGTGSLPFTSAGHYIVIRGITSDGKWLIGDSAHKDTNTQSWDPQQILTQMHDGSIYAITGNGGGTSP